MSENRQKGNETRKEICRKYDNEKSIADIAIYLDMKYQTVASVTKLYKYTGRIEKIAKRKQKPMKIDADGKDYIKNVFFYRCHQHLYITRQ